MKYTLRDLLQPFSMGGEDEFVYRRELVNSGLFTLSESLFIQDLIGYLRDEVKNGNARDGWLMCSAKFLQENCPYLTKEASARLLKSLHRKGFIRIQRRGIPLRRHIRIDMLKIVKICYRENKRGTT